MTKTADEAMLAAQWAGWQPADGQPYLDHTMPPKADPVLGHNGISPTSADPHYPVGTGPTWLDVLAEHEYNAQHYGDSINYQNPWTEELGIGDTYCCIAAATLVPHHHGVNWWPEAQFGARGYAYCPFGETGAQAHGVWEFDLASQGQPANLVPGDLVLYSWGNNGVADHCETVVTTYADETFDTVGYDTGTPNGCHFPIRRDRTFLLGVIHMAWAYTSAPIPPSPQGVPMYNPPLPPMYCSCPVPGGGVLCIAKDGSSYYLNVAPNVPSHPGMNTDPGDWGDRTPAEVRLDTRYPNLPFTIKDTSAEFYDVGYLPGQAPLRW